MHSADLPSGVEQSADTPLQQLIDRRASAAAQWLQYREAYRDLAEAAQDLVNAEVLISGQIDTWNDLSMPHGNPVSYVENLHVTVLYVGVVPAYHADGIDDGPGITLIVQSKVNQQDIITARMATSEAAQAANIGVTITPFPQAANGQASVNS